MNFNRRGIWGTYKLKGGKLVMTKKLIILLFIILMVGATVACTASTSVGGASIETGYEINDNFGIKSTKTTFAAGEEFYFSFNNSKQFDSDVLQLQLSNSESDEILLEHNYEVESAWDTLADTIWFNDPGKYKISCLINGKVRATQEVIVE